MTKDVGNLFEPDTLFCFILSFGVNATRVRFKRVGNGDFQEDCRTKNTDVRFELWMEGVVCRGKKIPNSNKQAGITRLFTCVMSLSAPLEC